MNSKAGRLWTTVLLSHSLELPFPGQLLVMLPSWEGNHYLIVSLYINQYKCPKYCSFLFLIGLVVHWVTISYISSIASEPFPLEIPHLLIATHFTSLDWIVISIGSVVVLHHQPFHIGPHLCWLSRTLFQSLGSQFFSNSVDHQTEVSTATVCLELSIPFSSC